MCGGDIVQLPDAMTLQLCQTLSFDMSLLRCLCQSVLCEMQGDTCPRDQ